VALLTCEVCGKALPAAVRSHARTCSPACRKRLSRAGVPTELRKLPRWVAHTPDKRPVRVDGSPASSTDPQTWSSFEDVAQSSRKGFVLNGDGIVCLDLDHCLAGGVPTTEVAGLLERLPRTYVEVSPSGDGLHVWGRGDVRAGRRLVVDGVSVEVYGSGRYITVTGRPFRSVPKLADLSTALSYILT
jgi:primase-polymerase (primpol)-like protein